MRKSVAISALLVMLTVPPLSAQVDSWPGPLGRPDSPERSGTFVGSFGRGPYYPIWRTVWPVEQAPIGTSKLRATLPSVGLMAGAWSDPFSFKSDPTFEFPAGSGVQYLDRLAISVGGIHDGDTLVSSSVVFNAMWGAEFFAPDDPYNHVTVRPIDPGIGLGLESEVVDTFTNAMYPNIAFTYDRVRRGYHIPLGIKVTKRLLAVDVGRYENVCLLDLTITNVSRSPISEGWVGLYFEPYAGRWAFDSYGPGSPSDDLVGSLRDIGSVYVIDNDGDPAGGYFRKDTSCADGVGIRLTRMYPSPTDTTFNWWYNAMYGNYDFAPRHKDRPGDPFRDFGFYFGMPDGDVNWYYTMHHPEWDYDEIRTVQIQPDDTLWMYPEDRAMARDFANGLDICALYSAGPFDLQPGQSTRMVFAVFGSDFMHTHADDGYLLLNGEYDRYYYRLNLDLFRERAAVAVDATNLLTDPHRPPVGLHPTYVSGDTVRLAWEPRVFDDILGYQLYITPVADSFMIARRTVRPGAEPDRAVPFATVGPDATEVELIGVDPSKFHFASIAHITADGPGERSPSVVIGYGNQTVVPDTVQMKRYHAFYFPGDTGVVLSWFPSENPDVAWYRIYKVTDSLQAADRYPPFFAIDSALVPVPPQRSGRTAGRPWFYYRMHPYDSVPAPQTGYVDSRFSTDAWYWVTAVNKYGDESGFSRLVTAERSIPATRDLLVIVSSTSSLHDWVQRDSLFAFYDRLLGGYDYDIYSWADTNRNVHADITYNSNWDDFARYRCVLVEEMTSSGILTKANEETYHTLERIIASGHDLAYFGTPPGAVPLNLNADHNTIRFDPESFESRFFNLDSLRLATWAGTYRVYHATDTLGGFERAIPERPDLPALVIDTVNDRLTSFIHLLFNIDHYLPLTPGFFPDANAEVLYRYGSRYPSTSMLEGLPCGLVSHSPGANVYTFGFHLWAMDSTDAHALVDYILDNQAPDAELDPYFLPRSTILRQNYPNPFNPSTTISFELQHSQHVRLEIFDLLGRNTVTLLDETVAAGPHQLEWRGRDRNGRRVASGIYFYRLTTDQGSTARKMVLVK